MSNSKTQSFSVDVESIIELMTSTEEPEVAPQSDVVRSTVFFVGKDPQVSAQQPPVAPDLFATLMKDGLNNPYVQLNFKINRNSITPQLIRFDVYRRKISTAVKKSDLFDAAAITHVSKNIPSYSKFSAETKAIAQIRPSLLPESYLNPNLFNQRVSANAADVTRMVSQRSDMSTSATTTGFQKVGSVDYGVVIKNLKNKKVYVSEKDFVNLYYNDRTPRFGETFEYYIVGVYNKIGGDTKSNTINVYVLDTTSVRAPASILAKTTSPTTLTLDIRIDDRDQVNRVFVFKKGEEDNAFKLIANVTNSNNQLRLFDNNVKYGQKYRYRVFLRNVYGTFSDPGEITTIVSTQKVTPQTRSNDLKVPVLSAIQDQNSDAIKITISPNDPKVSYYVLQRRNLSLYEKSFTVPGLDTDGYGAASGWENNKFSVNKYMKEINFIDSTAMKGGIYQYRICGVDLFGNKSSYSFALIRNTGKKRIRTPINLRTEVLRESPLRVKITWDDDNYGIRDVFYSIQRRKQGEKSYKAFPITKSNFIIDEFPVTDKIDFVVGDRPAGVLPEGEGGTGDVAAPINPEGSGGTGGRDLIVVEEPTITTRDPGTMPASQDDTGAREPGGVIDSSIKRPQSIPEFLEENTVYYYRVAALVFPEAGELAISKSNYSEEVEFNTTPSISLPIDLQAKIENARVMPTFVKLSWKIKEGKSRPDYWTIERKADSIYDTFKTIGTSYLFPDYIDKNTKKGNVYVYRVKSVGVNGNIPGNRTVKIRV